MNSITLEDIKETITSQHGGDVDQLRVIFSDSPRLIVEAPAGYGKTTTMISRLAFLYASCRIPNPKRVLGLTFSVNAALKIKREVAGKLPYLIGSPNSPVTIGEKTTITNYHGFCKTILKKYGYLLSPSLRKDVNQFSAVDEYHIDNNEVLRDGISLSEIDLLKRMDNCIKSATYPCPEFIHDYNQIVIQKMLPHDYLTHNSIILFVLELFSIHEQIKAFYRNLFSIIVVDEFQDTNCIAWSLLNAIIADHTQLLFLGDPLQRIYGFIGALPDIMAEATSKYDMTRVVLSKNYRFSDNAEMLKLDRNIRENASTVFRASISDDETAKLPGLWGSTQANEAEQVAEKVKSIIEGRTVKVAILFRARSKNAELVESELEKNGISYFYGMFTDEDVDYIEFHNRCQSLFIRRFGNQNSISKRALLAFSNSIKAIYASEHRKTIVSLLKLLDALIEKVSIDYADLVPEDKYSLLIDIFENRQLKQAMEYVDAQVILSTIHGAKGLEWDYVILCDTERWVFPSYHVCTDCINRFSNPEKPICCLPNPLPDNFQTILLDELSVFYVGITRAKKQVFVSASKTRLNNSGDEKNSVYSCLVSLTGVKLVQA